MGLESGKDDEKGKDRGRNRLGYCDWTDCIFDLGVTMEKTSEAQKRASRAWEARNPERAKAQRYKRVARLFIRTHATEENLQELEKLIAERRQELKKAGE